MTQPFISPKRMQIPRSARFGSCCRMRIWRHLWSHLWIPILYLMCFRRRLISLFRSLIMMIWSWIRIRSNIMWPLIPVPLEMRLAKTLWSRQSWIKSGRTEAAAPLSFWWAPWMTMLPCFCLTESWRFWENMWRMAHWCAVPEELPLTRMELRMKIQLMPWHSWILWSVNSILWKRHRILSALLLMILRWRLWSFWKKSSSSLVMRTGLWSQG